MDLTMDLNMMDDTTIYLNALLLPEVYILVLSVTVIYVV